ALQLVSALRALLSLPAPEEADPGGRRHRPPPPGRPARAPRARLGGAALREDPRHPRDEPDRARGGRHRLLLVVRVGHVDHRAPLHGSARLLSRRPAPAAPPPAPDAGRKSTRL